RSEVRQVPEGPARPGRGAVARRDRAAHLRERLGAGLEALGGAPEDDPQRIPPDALAEGRPGGDSHADGRLFLRRRIGAAAGLRPSTDEVVSAFRRINYDAIGSIGSIVNFRRACASRTARSANAGASALAKMNPR